MKKRAKKYMFSLGLDFRGVVSGCHAQHGECWLFPPLVDAFERMQTLPDSRCEPCVSAQPSYHYCAPHAAAAEVASFPVSSGAHLRRYATREMREVCTRRHPRYQVVAAPCFKEEGFRVEQLHTREVDGVEYALVAGELG